MVVDTKLSTVKPLHAKTMAKAFDFFRSDHGKKIISSGWKAAGIISDILNSDALQRARDDESQLVRSFLDPFSSLEI